MGIVETNPVSQLSLPPGFRFYPTDEELLVQYLCRKVAGHHFLQIIGDVDLYKHDPWVLPSKAVFGEKEWYFFSPRDRKYPNGSRPNRVAGSGYWKATGTDKIITSEGRKLGIKKALVFYIGKAPKGTKTNWIMHEYRLSESTRKSGSSRLDEWVLCRIYKKNSGAQKPMLSISTKEHSSNGSSSSTSSQFDDVLHSFPEIEDRSFALPRLNSVKTLPDEKLNFQNLGFVGSGRFDRESHAGMSSLPEIRSNSQIPMQHPVNDVYIPSVQPMYQMDSPSEKFGSSIEEEVESGIGTQRVENNSGFYQQNSNGFARTFSDSLDPFGFRFLTDPVSGKFLFGQ